MPVRERMVEAEGSQIQFWEDGDDKTRTVLLLHGGVLDAAHSWTPVIEPLAETFHVLAPNLPGYGGSTALPRPTLRGLVAWIHAFLRALDVEQAVVVGSSFGALPARLFAAAYPQMTPAVVLVNGGALPQTDGLIRPLVRLPLISNLLLGLLSRSTTAPASLDRMFYDKAALTPAIVSHARACTSPFADLMGIALRTRLPDNVNPLVPLLLLWGMNDGLTPVAEGEALKAHLPGAKLASIADCGHFPQLETPDVFVFQVTSYLDRLSRPSNNLPGVGQLVEKLQ